LLITASFGAALVVSAGLNSASLRPQRVAANLAAAALLVLSIVALGNGRLGLPAGDLNDTMEFAAADVEGDLPARVLIASTDPHLVPGADRAGPGFWYRLVDGSGMTHDEVWLPPARQGDVNLAAAMASIASGGELRAGALLAPYAVEWVVLIGPELRLDEVLSSQLDMIPIPLEEGLRVFQNSNRAPLAAAGDTAWVRSGTGFSGPGSEDRVRLAVNHDDGWRPDPQPVSWGVELSAADGRAWFTADPSGLAVALASAALAVAGLVMVIVGRLRR
jgi:hypothetical protein